MFKPQPITKRFYEGLDQGKFVALRCTECGNYEFPPLPTCRKCGSFEMEWDEVSGECEVMDCATLNPALGSPNFKPFAPYHIGECRLKEGPEINGIILGLTEKRHDKLRAMMPIKAKLITLQLDGFKTCAVQVGDELDAKVAEFNSRLEPKAAPVETAPAGKADGAPSSSDGHLDDAGMTKLFPEFGN